MFVIAENFFKALRNIEARAKKATNREELLSVRHDLVEFHNKYVDFRGQGAATRKVLAYIDGRLEGIKN